MTKVLMKMKVKNDQDLKIKEELEENRVKAEEYLHNFHSQYKEIISNI